MNKTTLFTNKRARGIILAAIIAVIAITIGAITLTGCETTTKCNHVLGDEATCTTHQTCTKCGEIIVEAEGHLLASDGTIDLSYDENYNITEITSHTIRYYCKECGYEPEITVSFSGSDYYVTVEGVGTFGQSIIPNLT